ncbi:MAG: 4-phosphoerythronate dehydrogenase [Bacteroidales bacterium]|nr:4-phosphoerythronate dehydrogenase [Bacteroidales bacterium]
MKIVVDKAIPFIEGVFEPYAEVSYCEGEAIGRDELQDADALVVRTRTRCDAALLEGTPVKMIATATIATDHIDLDYCREHNIFISNAAGSNAGGVMNYVFSALYGTAARKSIPLTGATMGIVGVGQVGSRVEQMARHLGFKVLLWDPPRAEAEGPGQFCSLDELLRESDIVTLHVGLSDATRGMADASFFAKMKFGAFFINSARGELMVDSALMEAIPRLGPVIIDSWNHEPDVDKRLIEAVDIATPHIAGYSYQGKQRSSASAVRAVARYFGIRELFEFFPVTDIEELEAVKLDLTGMTQGQIAAAFQYNYPVFTDDFMFRVRPDSFVQLRNDYRYRREFYI